MRKISTILLLSFLATAGCTNHGVVSEPNTLGDVLPEDTWVATDPIQCLGNPWERDWVESHNGDRASYPGDPITPELDPMEIEIITDYYERQGVKVLQAETVQKHDNVCAGCMCPLGYTLYLLVPEEDVSTMLDLGFRLETPGD